MPVSQCESDLQKVRIERVRAYKTVEEYMENFERKRTQDVKVQMHATLQELRPSTEFTKCHNNMDMP